MIIYKINLIKQSSYYYYFLTKVLSQLSTNIIKIKYFLAD